MEHRTDPHFAEALGTFVLVFSGCGTAVLAASGGGVGPLGVALAFGFSLLVGIYALGPISGAHFNPAVSVGLACAGRFRWGRVPGYVGAQLAGAILAAGLVAVIAKGQPGGYDPAVAGLAANGFGAHSPGGFDLASGLVCEILLSFVFVAVVLGATASRGATPLAGIAIGLAFALVHLIGIPVTNVSVNPARSTGPALFVGGWALSQLWLFWLAPLAGGALAGILARWLYAAEPEAAEEARATDRATTQRPAPPTPA